MPLVGSPGLLYTSALGRKWSLLGTNISALQQGRAWQEGSCSKVRDSADGPQCWMKGWERDTGIRSWAEIAGRGRDGAPRLPDGDTSARKGDMKVWGWE